VFFILSIDGPLKVFSANVKVLATEDTENTEKRLAAKAREETRRREERENGIDGRYRLEASYDV
jgi:hypothetical protein